jgi:thermitase
MKRITVVTCAIFLLIGCSLGGKKEGPLATGHSPVDSIPNEFVFSGEQAVVENYLSSMGVKASIKPVIPGSTRLFQVQYEGDVDVKALTEGLGDQVDYAEPNYRVQGDASVDKISWPNDRLFFKQWALNNIGQNPPYGLPGSEGADLDAIRAWTVSKGSKDIVVAVIDTGIDYTHPDIKDNIWVNEKESEKSGGIAGKDDDGDGYIDDVYGYDFSSSDRTDIKWGAPGDPDPMDENGHGTHCAGVIGAAPGNAQGVAGINWNVRIMPLRFLGTGGGGSVVDAVRAIYYAIKKNVNVISNSWGGGGDSKLLRDAIADAQKAGILFVVAAGNDGKNIDVDPTYPASIDRDSKGRPITNILVVGASDNQDNPASFSNYGHEKVHVFAPGVQIVSTYPVKLAEDNKPYAIMSGTSMATPYVAGLAALMMAANPSLRKNPELVKQLITSSADFKESLLGKASSSGRINAYRAVTAKATATPQDKWTSKSNPIAERAYHQELVDIRRPIQIPGAKAIRVHFDFIQIQPPYDSIYIYDKHFRLISRIEEPESRDYWSAVVPGDTVHVRFTNALVKQVTMALSLPQDSEAKCLAMGATEIVQTGKEYRCMTDDAGDGGSKTYGTFNSEGYSIDRVEVLAGQGAKL